MTWLIIIVCIAILVDVERLFKAIEKQLEVQYQWFEQLQKDINAHHREEHRKTRT